MTSKSEIKRRWALVNAREAGWICVDCAKAVGADFYEGHVATFHTGPCGVCLETKRVTEPRDFKWR